MDVKKALSILKKIGFGQNFMHLIKVLLNNQQSCVINGGFATRERCTPGWSHFGIPVNACLISSLWINKK